MFRFLHNVNVARRPRGLVMLVLAGGFLAGCGTTPLRPGDSAHSMDVAGRQRQWRIHLPSAYTGDRAWPLVIAFHGLLGTPGEFEKLTGLDAVADRDGFIAVYPRGVDRSWAAGVNAPADKKGVDDVAFVATLLKKMEQRYAVDADRVVITGFSNGAHLVQLLACRMASEWLAVVPVSGTMPPAELPRCRPGAPVSVVAFHGTADPIDPYQGGKVQLPGGSPLLSAPATIAAWARLNGCESDAHATRAAQSHDGIGVTRIRYTGCKGAVRVALYRIDGGGHTWPGGAQYLPKFMIGRATHAVDASAIIGALATGAPLPARAGEAQSSSSIMNSDLAAPQSGQVQSSGMSSHLVPGAIPSSGRPSASS